MGGGPSNQRALYHKGMFSLFAGMICAMVPLGSAEAVQAPQYLSIPSFQQCLSTQTMGSYDAVCLPMARPKQCPTASWRALRRLSGDQKMPHCRGK